MKKINKKLKNYIDRLHEVSPLPSVFKNVSVRLVDPKSLKDREDEEVHGYCESDIDAGTCRIRLTDDFEEEDLETLLHKYILDHEWAHARADFIIETLRKAGLNYEADFLHDHGIAWAMSYGQIYQNMAGTL